MVTQSDDHGEDGGGQGTQGQDSVKPGPTREQDTVRIQLLGQFRVSIGSRTIEDADWYLRKAKALVKLLVLAPSHRLHRGELMDILWPDLDIDAATNNLHKALYISRRVLEPDLPAKAPSGYLHINGDFISLDCPGGLFVDVEEFASAAQLARDDGTVEAYRRAVELYPGDLLPEDRYEDWAVRLREALQSTYLNLLFEMASVYEDREDYPAALETLQDLVARDPAHEEAQAKLIRLLAASGNRQAALRQYQRLREVLAEEFDVEPAPALEALYQQILSGTFAHGAPGGPAAPATERQSSPPGGLIGRDKEITYLFEQVNALSQGRGGLIAIAGESGIGKSRLVEDALQYASKRGTIVLRGVGYRYRSTHPYHLIATALEEFALRVPPETLQALVTPNEALMARIAPGLIRPLDVSPDKIYNAEVDPAAAYEVLQEFLIQLANYAPVILSLENAHLGDEQSIGFLQHVSRHLQSSPVLILATFSDTPVEGEIGEKGGHRELLEHRATKRVDLGPLGMSDMLLLAGQLLGDPVDTALGQTVDRLAAGNPHYVEEAVRALQGRKRIIFRDGKWRLRQEIAITWGREQLRARKDTPGDARLAPFLRRL